MPIPRVINTRLIEGIRTSHLEAHSYAASKAGVNHLTRIMAMFFALACHIAVNAIAPGYFPSKMTDAIDEHGAKEVVDDAPMKRMGDADDLARDRHLPRLEGQRLRLRCGHSCRWWVSHDGLRYVPRGEFGDD